MPQNVEIKARAKNLHRQKRKASLVAEHGPALILQSDTFFNVPHGRLKLREFEDGSAQLIQYDRPNESSACISNYHAVEVSDCAAMKKALTASLGVRGEVKKRRWLFLSHDTRIHFDSVESLGDFIELEVMLRNGTTTIEGEEVAAAALNSGRSRSASADRSL